jgi:hypothetical protein
VGLVVRLDVEEAARVVRERVGPHDHGLADGRDGAADLGLVDALLGELGRKGLALVGGGDLGLTRFPRVAVLDDVPDREAAGAQDAFFGRAQVDGRLVVLHEVADVMRRLEPMDGVLTRVRHHDQAPLDVLGERRRARAQHQCRPEQRHPSQLHYPSSSHLVEPSVREPRRPSSSDGQSTNMNRKRNGAGEARAWSSLHARKPTTYGEVVLSVKVSIFE